MTDARVLLWGRDIGAVSWIKNQELGVFQYQPDFVRSMIEVAPLAMPLGTEPWSFPALPRDTFKGLPGMLADSLPDKFGNTLIDAWLATAGRSKASFDPVQRLCYIGSRGMGALEFKPALTEPQTASKKIEVANLVTLANRILAERANLGGVLDDGRGDTQTMNDILRVGTSAGGARAKALLAWNPETNEFRSGQTEAGNDFEHWLLKFDGVSNNRDKELDDPLGFGRVEFAYYLMATDAGLIMSRCRLHHEHGRSHFMTRRFDRTATHKLHMQSLAALRHFDYNQPSAYSYEQAIETIRLLRLPRQDLEQQFLRAVFNVVARNQDDHVKNIAFLMDQQGQWSLAPAFDVTYNWNPDGQWTGSHQMSINGKRRDFSRDDLLALAARADIKRHQALDYIEQVVMTVRQWPAFAATARVSAATIEKIAPAHRLDI